VQKAEPLCTTIIFIALSALSDKIESDWQKNSRDVLPRRCPLCVCDSIIGHGRRRKQAHDEHHDWIEIRRGRCVLCGTTFTFLPVLSLPYTQYSLLARAQALLGRFIEHCTWEDAVPRLKDPNRVPDASTLRRWACGLDPIQPAASLRRQTLTLLARWLRGDARTERQTEASRLLTPILQVLRPLRL
jgi:hypothetical protein